MSDPAYKFIGMTEDKVIEECAELIKAIIKAKRFGWLNCHPDRPHITNAQEVQAEMEDCRETFARLHEKMKALGY